MTCERCNAEAKGYVLFDFCAKCSKNLCDGCMEKGCCGVVPAESGNGDDEPDDERPSDPDDSE